MWVGQHFPRPDGCPEVKINALLSRIRKDQPFELKAGELQIRQVEELIDQYFDSSLVLYPSPDKDLVINSVESSIAGRLKLDSYSLEATVSFLTVDAQDIVGLEINCRLDGWTWDSSNISIAISPVISQYLTAPRLAFLANGRDPYPGVVLIGASRYGAFNMWAPVMSRSPNPQAFVFMGYPNRQVQIADLASVVNSLCADLLPRGDLRIDIPVEFTAATVTLSELALTIERERGVTAVSATVVSDRGFTLFNGKFAVGALAIHFDIPLQSIGSLYVSVSAEMLVQLSGIDPISVALTAAVPDLYFEGSLGRPLRLEPLMSHLGIQVPKQLSDLNIAECEFGVRLGGGSDWRLRVGLRDIARIPLGLGKEVELRELRVDIDPTGFMLYGDCGIAGASLFVSCRYSDEVWTITGGTSGYEVINLDNFVRALRDQFNVDVSDLPDSCSKFEINRIVLQCSVGGAQNRFRLTCMGTISLADSITVRGEIDIEIGEACKFSGMLKISGMEFKLCVESREEKDIVGPPGRESCLLLAAYYSDDTGQKIEIDSLLKQLFSARAETNLALLVKRALFVYAKEGTSPASILVGVSIGLEGLGKQLSNIEFLKVVGLGHGESIEFEDLQMLYSTGPFSRTAVQRLNGWLPPGSVALPNPSQDKSARSPEEKTTPANAIEPGFAFSAKLNLGSSQKTLTLPVSGGDQQSNSRDPGPAQAATQQKHLAPGTKWFDIKKSVGPVYVGRVGFLYRSDKNKADNAETKEVAFLLDSSVELLGLHVGLLGFGISIPIDVLSHADALNQIRVDLQGLELGFRRGPIEISGGLLKAGDNKYVGSVLIKTDAFSIFGFGAYETVNKQSSLFLFAVLDKDLGGPPCFHVTGLAFGFGYNRRLTLPGIERVAECGLVKAAMQPDPTDLLTQALQISENVSTPAVGEYWLAAGVKFTSFEMIESFALLAISFGTETVITILGLSRMTVPAKLQDVSKDAPIIAYAELAFKVSFRPDSGVLAAEARLTPNSYVFSKECKISGGFAFYAWFKDIPDNKDSSKSISAGDFVVSLGGYHPNFKRPEHYPIVPRLRLDWQLSDKLQITGEVYFALTPSRLMLGGRLSALFQDQGLRAWFVAYADFMIAWQPLAYQAEIGLRIGIAYVGTIAGIAINFGIELSAQLQLSGPPFSGTAEIQCTFISFTIQFGKKAEPKPLNWEQFKSALLPEDNQSLTIAVVAGLIKELECKELGASYVIVNPYQLQLLVKSAVPVQRAFKNEHDMKLQPPMLGIKPMGLEKLDDSLLVVKISRNEEVFD
jgi:hypothetical protein